MATSANYFERKTATSARPGVSPAAPPSPHTPQRTISSAYSSPGGGYRVEEEHVVLELGARHLRAGFAGESRPRCTLRFGREESRRVGDYRRWLPGYDEIPRAKRRVVDWGVENELWRMDLREVDIGLVEDKIERTVREAYTRYLLLDAKSRRMILVVPSVLPHQLLSSILSVLFTNFQIPGISLFPAPAMSALSAGQRSGLVVDIGWHETTLTAMYDLREIAEVKTTRAMRTSTIHMGKLLELQITSDTPETIMLAEDQDDETKKMQIDFEHAEEVLIRVAWCEPTGTSLVKRLAGLSIDEDSNNKTSPLLASEGEQQEEDPIISITQLSPLLPPINVPFSTLNKPIESALFAQDTSLREQDDHELPIHYLLYKTLLSLPPDARSLCMSRIIITGGGSNIPGIKSRLLAELSTLVEQRGWDPVWGKAADKRRAKLSEIDNNRRTAAATSEPEADTSEKVDPKPKDKMAVAAAFAEQIPDPIEEKLRREAAKGTKPTVSGVVRGVESLGSWAGASLAGTLRIKAVVEVDRETFLQHGLAGARKETDASVIKARQSSGLGLARTGVDTSAWTLGAWG